MHIEVELVPARKTQRIELGEGTTVADLLRRIGLAVDAHVAVRGEAPLPEDEPLLDGDRITVIAVASGG